MATCVKCVWLVAAAAGAVAGASAAAEGGRTVLADVAQELIARSGTSSQVLSLNLTNLVIMLVLKGLLVAAAMWGGKGGEGAPLHRSLPQPPAATFLSEPELALLVSYLMGESESGNGACLLRVACEEPKKAREYIAAGQMALKAANILDNVIPVSPKYARLLEDMTSAARYGADNGAGTGTCQQRYQCGRRHDQHNNTV